MKFRGVNIRRRIPLGSGLRVTSLSLCVLMGFMKHAVCFTIQLFLLTFLKAGAAPFKGQKFAVSGPSPHLPAVVREIYQAGGNIFDGAVASALSLAVTHPYYVSFGSGGFALLKSRGKTRALDFRERAPQNTGPDFYVTRGLSSRVGGAAVGVPGFLAGLWHIHKEYGKLPWHRLTAPALRLAQKGFSVSGDYVEITSKQKKKLNPSALAIFFKKKGAFRPGDILKQPRLALAFKRIRKNPLRAFYGGPLGRDVVSAVTKNKGVMTEADLKNYQVRWFEPVSVSFQGYQIYSMPLPSSGGLILSRALKLIEIKQLHEKALYSVEELHLLGEILARAFRPRNLMGDPENFSEGIPDWLSEGELNKLSRTISSKEARRLKPLKESGETTHISLMDHKGEAASVTLTLNGFYGSGLATEKYGIVLNNQMDDFTTVPGKANMYGMIQGRKNRVMGGRAPLSSMTPLIAERKGKTVLALGGAGGPMIISAVLQTLYRHIAGKLNIEQAIQAPRIHHQFLPRELFVEEKRFSPEIILQLKMKGHKIRYRKHIAQIFGVAVDQKGRLSAGHETRREGFSGGH